MSFSLSTMRSLRLTTLTVFTVITGVVVWRTWNPSQAATRPTAAPIAVLVAEVTQRDVPHRISSIGSVESLHSVTLRPQVSGVITEVLFHEGQRVEQGAVLARIDARSIRASLQRALAERDRNAAELKAARLDAARYDKLVEQNAVSRQTVEKQLMLIEQLEATIRANDAAIAVERVQLSHSEITAPFSGRVGIRQIDAGNWVPAGSDAGLVTVTQMDPISVLFTLPQEHLSQLRELASHDASAEVVAYKRGADTPLARGHLTMINNTIDPATRTIRLRAEFPNTALELWPGQAVTTELQIDITHAATVVPARAVQQGLRGPFVYRVRDSKAELVGVAVAYQDDDLAILTSGVTPGDTVVTDGHSRLKPGVLVRAVPSTPILADTADQAR